MYCEYLWRILNFKHQHTWVYCFDTNQNHSILFTDFSSHLLLKAPLLDVYSLLIILPSCNLGTGLLEEVSSIFRHPCMSSHQSHASTLHTRKLRVHRPVEDCIVTLILYVVVL